MRWFALLLTTALAGCYAIPSEHNVEPVQPADGGGEPEGDGDVENVDAGTESDAGDDRDAEAGEPMDAKVDAGGSLDASDGATGSQDAEADAATSVCGPCESATPECNVNTQKCVACLTDDAGACQGKLCSNANTCIECRTNTDCKNPAASVCDVSSGTCVPCVDGNDGHCSHINGKGVCSAGACVQCTAAKPGACKTAENQPAVCDNRKRECTTKAVGSANTCDECIADAQCAANNLCVLTKLGSQDVGYFCQPIRAGSCASKRPYIKEVNPGLSIDGKTDGYCTLRTTTCPAIVQRGTGYLTNCGVNAQGLPTTTNPVRGEDSICGVPGMNDGFCVSPGAGQYVCTVPCAPLSEAANNFAAPDCPDLPGVDPTCVPQAHGAATDLLCSVN